MRKQLDKLRKQGVFLLNAMTVTFKGKVVEVANDGEGRGASFAVKLPLVISTELKHSTQHCSSKDNAAIAIGDSDAR
jgi:hypothetical protein